MFMDKVSFVNGRCLGNPAAETRFKEVAMTALILTSMRNTHGPDLLRRALATLGTWQDRIRARRDLARLSERELHDFGASWSSIAEEVNKPFWRA
jgi:uncharacterized protein YjiS (DUF1127 family)